MRGARGLPVAVASLGLVAGVGAASFSAGAAHVYLVQPGDSLWAISQANGLTVQQLAAANHMQLSDILLIGRHLIIPSKQPQPAPAPSARSDRPASRATTISASAFCGSFTSPGGPWGVLPQLLRQSPARLALQPLFVRWANHYNLSVPLLEAIAWQESGWQQGVVSPAGAVGAGQIMPETASFISTSIIGMPMNIHSVSDNIRMSAAFLAYLAGVEGNNRCATIAAYYEGPDNLRQYGVFADTQVYVASVEALIPRFE
jgi:soluble lytic murein transglycosylase-like protein